MKDNKLPEFLKSVLWSYDFSKMDKDKNRNLIISQGLNYGDDEVVAWIKQNYTENQIKEVVTHPRRGIWWRERLRKWLGYFNIMLDPLDFEVAIRDLNLRPKLVDAFFARKGL